jgi:hypothetical protein
MKASMIIVLHFCLSMVAFNQKTFAQNHAQTARESLFHEKINELCTKYNQEGFVTFKRGDLKMERNTEQPIFMQLTEGRWYNFIIVGDPIATKFEMKLGMAGYGDFITDKFRNEKTGEFWTNFSFVCPRTGKYLMTFFQKGHHKDLMGHVAILQKPIANTDGAISYR